jgi:hypothetical protein
MRATTLCHVDACVLTGIQSPQGRGWVNAYEHGMSNWGVRGRAYSTTAILNYVALLNMRGRERSERRRISLSEKSLGTSSTSPVSSA